VKRGTRFISDLKNDANELMYQISIVIRNYKNNHETSGQGVVYSYLQIRTEVVKSSSILE